MIVTSATYKQSSKSRADLDAKDLQNKLLGKQNRLRLEAEILRDAALSASRTSRVLMNLDEFVTRE